VLSPLENTLFELSAFGERNNRDRKGESVNSATKAPGRGILRVSLPDELFRRPDGERAVYGKDLILKAKSRRTEEFFG